MDFKLIFEWTKNCYTLLGIYVLWILLFYTASHSHAHFCTPRGFYGLLITPFIVQTPHCVAFRWILTNGDIYIIAFWSIMSRIIVRRIRIFDN